MAKGVKIGKVTRKKGSFVYVAGNGDVMETMPARGRKKATTATKKKAAPKKAAVKKSAPKKKTAVKKTTAKRKTTVGKTAMNALDWGKTTAERNNNLDKYNSLKTVKSKQDFVRALKKKKTTAKKR